MYKGCEEMTQEAVTAKIHHKRETRASSRAVSSFAIGVLLLLVNLPIAAAGLVALVVKFLVRPRKGGLRLRMPCEAIADKVEPNRA